MKKKTGGGAAQEPKNYILEYYQAIMDGTETAGYWITEWYRLIVDGLQKKLFFFNQKKANVCIRFIETYGRHHEGELAPGRIKLNDIQGIYRPVYG